MNLSAIFDILQMIFWFPFFAFVRICRKSYCSISSDSLSKGLKMDFNQILALFATLQASLEQAKASLTDAQAQLDAKKQEGFDEGVASKAAFIYTQDDVDQLMAKAKQDSDAAMSAKQSELDSIQAELDALKATLPPPTNPDVKYTQADLDQAVANAVASAVQSAVDQAKADLKAAMASLVDAEDADMKSKIAGL